MNIHQLKNIMKQVNEPNEFIMDAYDLTHSLYWIYKLDNVRVKTLYTPLETYRKASARFDVFINGQFIGDQDYIFEQKVNTLYVKFIRANFPAYDADGYPYTLIADIDSLPDGVFNPNQSQPDEIKIKGDLELF